MKEFKGKKGESTRLFHTYGENHSRKRKYSVSDKKKQFILHIENMSGYSFGVFVERLKNNSYDCIEILKDVLNLLDISSHFIDRHFKNLWVADLKRKPKMDEWSKISQQLSALSPDELKFLFLAYAKDQTPASWVDEFKALRDKEKQLLKDYSHLPNNKAVSLARGVIWDLFIVRSLDKNTTPSSAAL
jgi:hypothetical protein